MVRALFQDRDITGTVVEFAVDVARGDIRVASEAVIPAVVQDMWDWTRNYPPYVAASSLQRGNGNNMFYVFLGGS